MTTTTTTRSGSNLSSSSASNPPSKQQQQQPAPGSAAAASASLSLLLREDSLLTQHELHISGKTEEAAFSYAAALLEDEDQSAVQQKARDALGEVDRKLALVQSLAERVSRTSPEEVAGPLLRLHGYSLDDENDDSNNNALTLLAIRERCNRLKRQGEVLDGVARRVESSLQRGLKRMDTATSRLSRVLDLSATLKMILRLQFESSKLSGYDLEDLRDLTRAAASVAVVKDLLDSPELQQSKITVVEAMRPEAQETARAVRRAAAALLLKHDNSRSSAAVELGATLQVYYHLGELPQAAWSAVTGALETIRKTSDQFWSPTSITTLAETAQAQAKASLLHKKPNDAALQRALKKSLRELRAQAATDWAAGITDAANKVWNLHRVLCRKTDPVTRQVFLNVVAEAPCPPEFKDLVTTEEFNIFSIFWNKFCQDLGQQLEALLDYEHGKLTADVAALYPAVRSAALTMLASLYDTMQAASTGAWDDSATAASGILGGSAILNHGFWTTSPQEGGIDDATSNTLGMASADTWTRAGTPQLSEGGAASDRFSSQAGTTTSLSAIFNSDEWKALQGSGLYPLQQAFLEACSERLCEPIHYMFPEGVTVDENGVPVSILPPIPSRYDLQKLDTIIRQELSLADPRDGGGELSMTTMIAEMVVDMVERFCVQVKSAVSDVGENGCLRPDGSPTEALIHDVKVAGVMSSLTVSLRNAPDNTFVVPYRPATSPQYEEAASACQVALLPALYEIENMITGLILSPLCRALNRRIGAAITKMHHGTYFEESLHGMDGTGTSFVEKHLSDLYDTIAQEHLSSLPAEYAVIVASTVATYSLYTFVSNVSLIRPLGETARLHITQDLADFELALEQFVVKAGGSLSLHQVEQGKPYAELRAVRQMLFWTGLDDDVKTAASISKSMLTELWIKDVRPSTVCNFLFSFAPALLSSPHHSKRMKPEEYVSTLVQLDGKIEDGETNAWMTTLACCDAYQQRESLGGGGSGDGDKRIAGILMVLGPELQRRRRH